jgi:hypothetical protein
MCNTLPRLPRRLHVMIAEPAAGTKENTTATAHRPNGSLMFLTSAGIGQEVAKELRK